MAKKRFKYTVVSDDIANTVDKAYDAFPDRVYVVDVQGNVAFQGAPGPFGFKDSIKRAKKWLFDYKRTLNPPQEKKKKPGT